ncbi:hypothetical protein COO60DRAFT_863334 [Scenedesmus sp. NREL 46B-D3]|nr:hypothetical protein COO60DRAFT_863334 [Scenedesmus sp. NREL 46B-D3]
MNTMQAVRLRRNACATSSSTAAHTQAVFQFARIHRRRIAHVEAALCSQFPGQHQLHLPMQRQQQRQQQLIRCSSSSGNAGEEVFPPAPCIPRWCIEGDISTDPTIIELQLLFVCRAHNHAHPVVVVEGDIVTFHMTCADADGKVLETTKDTSKENEPMAFEVGAGDIISNPLFQAFDGALRGLAIGESVELQISGGEWQKELLFVVPREHPEIERLEGRYKNLGGLHEGLAVELANGSMAVVVEAGPEQVKLDANNMMAGKTLLFTLEVLSIDSSSNS